jgi:uncharacterized membrane protein YhaH (DUF805 family)
MSMFADGLRELRRFTDYRGRSTRTDMVAFWLVTFVIGAVSTLAAGLLDYLLDADYRVREIATIGLQAALLLPWIALWVRRLHDQGRSGWWLLLFVPVLIASFAKHYYLAIDDFEALFGREQSNLTLAGGLLALPVLILLCLPGSEAANRYGPNPRYGEAEAAS